LKCFVKPINGDPNRDARLCYALVEEAQGVFYRYSV
jgi:hypothetical protein